MKKKIKRGTCLFAIGIFMLAGLLMPQRVSAAEKTGSLTVYYHGVTPEGNAVDLSGAEFSLYKVGEKVKNEWKLQGDFENAAVNLTDMSASGQRKAAEQLYAFAVKEKLEGEVKTTGEDGRAVFYNLSKGFYLCASADDVACGNGTFHSAPFLVFIPEVDADGNCAYDVTAEPKNEWNQGDENPPETKPENPPETKPEKSDDNATQTGDDTNITLLGFLMTASMLVIIIGANRKMYH